MRVLLIGATGNIGQRILKEALNKGYKVTAVQRNPEALTMQHPHLEIIKGDLLNEAELPELLAGYNVIVSAISSVVDGMSPSLFKKANENLITALKRWPDKRLIIVGGAGSSEISPGLKKMYSSLMDEIPEAWKPAIFVHGDILECYEKSSINWTYFSPANRIQAGERTGKYKLGTTNMIFDAHGESIISYEDYAMALVDEIKNQHSIRKQFTIGY